jgi:two-component system, NtrC family, response regulator HydG
MKGLVLVVDDDRHMVKTLCAVLKISGWNTLAAHTGEDAVRLAGDAAVTAVLMDVKMPGMNGVEAFQQIRRVSPRLPVILMTAYSAHELVAEAEREGVLSVLPKPIPWSKLNELLRATLERQEGLLIVDDDAAFLSTLTDLLAERGRRCLQARSLEEALALLEREAPGIVLLDLKLDHTRPRDAALAIKKVSPAAVLILCSGYPAMIDETIASLPQGWVYASLKKPFAPERLMGLLDAVSH